MEKVTVKVLALLVCLILFSTSIVLTEDFCEGNFDCERDEKKGDA